EALKTTARSQLCLVGAQVPLLSQLGAEPFPQVLRLNFAGGRFPQERLPELRVRFPNARIFNNYGCAEAMPRLCVRPAEASDDASFIGAPLPGVELRVQQGELQFRSDTSAVGTLDAQGFAPIAADTWTATGDLAEAHPDGTFKLLGRAGEVFKRYGEKVSLVQLFETVQLAWPFSAGFYRQADRAGEDGCVLVLSPRPQEPDVRALLQQFRARHPRPHWPLRIESLELLPLLASGKVDTRALAAAEGKTVHWDQRL
ncbi:MAG: acyl--CoA ligase, partial [Deltaproteobacteria bacterium]|nr:acyl--CoA ligase [Deltaproteobacteria bacterium]